MIPHLLTYGQNFDPKIRRNKGKNPRRKEPILGYSSKFDKKKKKKNSRTSGLISGTLDFILFKICIAMLTIIIILYNLITPFSDLRQKKYFQTITVKECFLLNLYFFPFNQRPILNLEKELKYSISSLKAIKSLSFFQGLIKSLWKS